MVRALGLMLLLALPATGHTGVNLRNGNFYFSPDCSGPACSARLSTYNSKSTGAGWFGFGWGSPFETRLFIMPDGSAVVKEHGSGATSHYGTRSQVAMAVGIQRIIDNIRAVEKLDTSAVREQRAKLSDIDRRVTAVERYGMGGELAEGVSLVDRDCEQGSVVRRGEMYLRTGCDGDVDTFNQHGWLTRRETKSGDLYKFEYEGTPYPARIILGSCVIAMEWNLSGQVTRRTTRCDGETVDTEHYEYGDRSRLVSLTPAAGIPWRFQYDDKINMTEVRFPDGRTRRITYEDTMSLAASVMESDNSGAVYEYGGEAPPGAYWTVVTRYDTEGNAGKPRRYEYPGSNATAFLPPVTPAVPPAPAQAAVEAAIERGAALTREAQELEKAGNTDQAFERHRQAVALWRGHPELAHDAAVGAWRIGYLLREAGRQGEAESWFRQALAIDEETHGPEDPEVAHDLVALTGLLSEMGRPTEAEALADRAVRIRETALGAEHAAVADALDMKISILDSVGRFAQAMPLARRMLAISEKRFAPNDSHVAEALATLAGLYSSLGRDADALPLRERILAVRRSNTGPDSYATAVAFANLGYTLDNLGKVAAAAASYRAALAIHEKLHVPGQLHEHDHVTAISNLAYGQARVGELDEALAGFRAALAHNEQRYGAHHLHVARSLRHLGNVLLTMKRPDEARPLLERALLIAVREREDQPVLRAQIQISVARMYEALGLPDLAILYGKLSVNTLQALRADMASMEQASQSGFLKKYVDHYQQLAGWLIDAGRMAEAMQILVIIKEDEYNDFISRGGETAAQTNKAAFTPSEQRLAERFEKVNGQVFRLAEEQRVLVARRDSAGTLSAADAARYDANERELQLAERAFETELRAIARARRPLRASRQEEVTIDGTLRGVIGELGAGVVLIKTVTMPDELRLLLSHAEVSRAYKVGIGEQELRRKVAALMQALRNHRRDPRPAAAALYDVLIRPIEQELEQAGTRLIMVSFDGALRYVPVAALHDGKRYLVEKYAVSVFNDAARDRLVTPPAGDWTIVGLGVSKAHTVGAAQFSPLPSVPVELAGIVRDAQNPAGILPGRRLLDADFSAETLRVALHDNPRVVHIASHFSFTPNGNDTDSFLLLGDGSPLTLRDFGESRFRMTRVDLLTLSACETGMGDKETDEDRRAGEEVESLAVMAQRKGARSVMATMWKVADDSTAQFMQAFYRLHQQNLTKAEALRRTQLELLQGAAAEGATGPAFAHPYYWGAFVLMGNWL